MDLLFFNPNSLTRLGALADAATGEHRVALLAIIVALVVLHILGHAVIGWQLWQLHKYDKQREREVDAMGQRLRQQAQQAEESTERLRQALDRQRAVLGPLLRPTP